MKRAQIKQLADSIAEYAALSEKDLNWIIKNFSRQDLKLFSKLLQESVKNKNVMVYYAGEMSEENKNKIKDSFKGKNIQFEKDDKRIAAGMKLEYGDYIWDYSVPGIVKRILNSIRENL